MHLHRLFVMTSVDTTPDAGVRSVSPVPTLVTGSNWSRATWALLVVLCGALFLDGLDISMIGVALPSIGSDLHMAPGSLQWIVSAYVLGYGGLLLLGRRATGPSPSTRCAGRAASRSGSCSVGCSPNSAGAPLCSRRLRWRCSSRPPA